MFWSKVNINNVNCARETTFIFDRQTVVLVKVSEFLRQNMSRPEGTRTPNLRIHAECCNLLSYQGKLTFEMITVRGQQHSFSTHERLFLWKCQRFWDRKRLDLRGNRTPNLRIHAERSNLLSNHGGTFAVPWFWTIGTATKISRRIPLLRKDVMRSCWILNVLFLATGHISKFIEEYF